MKTFTTVRWRGWHRALLFVSLLFASISLQGQTGNSCADPILIASKTDCSPQTYVYANTATERWFEFKAIGTSLVVRFSTAGLPSPANIDHVYLYTQTDCFNPIAEADLTGDTLLLSAGGLTDGAFYKLRITRAPVGGISPLPEASFRMCAYNPPASVTPPDNSDCFTCGGGNLVFNGDFEQGFTGFSSTHTYRAPQSGWPWGEGNFSVTDSAGVEDFNGGPWSCTNRTPASDLFLIADISQGTFPSAYIWLQDVTVTPNTTYTFSCWVNNLVPPANNIDDPDLTLMVNGQVVETAVISETPDEWVYLCGEYTTPATGVNSTNARCVIYANVPGNSISGHDIAIDDIVLSAGNVPPSLYASESTICVGECVTLYTDAVADYYDWGTLHPTTTVPYIEICPTAPGSINASVTVICGEGGVTSQNILIDVVPFPEEIPDIIGSNQMCCDGQVYTVPFYPNYTYDWSVDQSVVFTGQGTNSIAVDWAGVPWLSATITLVITSPDGCTATVQYTVGQCCTDLPPAASPPFYVTNLCGDTYASDFITNNNGGSNTVSLTNQSFVIHGNFIIDVPLFNFLNTDEIYFGQEAKILIEAGNSLVFDGCSLQASCNYMWDGIYIEDNTASLTMNNNMVRDALNAVVSENGGHYNLTQNLFTQNYKGVVVRSYGAPHTGIFSDNTVNSISSFLIPPYNGGGRRTEVGVEIFDNTLVNIESGNAFDNMNFGVRVIRTNANVRGNSFANMTSTAAATDQSIGSAIYAQSSPSTSLLRVGGQPAQGNSFTNCYQGVNTMNNVSVAVQNNSFDDMGLLGVSVFGNINGIVDIRDNVLNNSGVVGINCFANDNSNISIRNNNITFPAGSTNALIEAGILVGTPFALQNNAPVLIENNFIVEPERGIRLNNIPNAVVTKNKVRWFVANPDIFFGGVDLKGILLTNCAGAEVTLNQILRQHNSNPTINTETMLVGIESENSNNIVIERNTTGRLGTGILMRGSNSSSTLSCNTAARDYAGFRFDNADIGDQGATNSPSDNKWTQNVGPYKMDGELDAIANADWHHRNANAFNPNPYSNVLFQSDLLLFGGASGQSVCAGGGIGPADKREKRFGKIVRNEKVFVNNAAEHRFYDKYTTFDILSKDQSLLNLGTVDDADYQAFYSTEAATNIGKLCQVATDIENGNYAAADALNATIVPNNLMETNCKRVNEIYLATWANGITTFDPLQQADLEAIACQDGLAGGTAVYSARALIGWLNLPCAQAKSVKQPAKPSKEVLGSFVGKVYPNPNNGVMQLEYQLNEGQQGELQILDLSGKLVSAYNLDAATNVLTIQENKLTNGVYMYRITVNGSLLDSGKLVIVK